MKKFLEHLEFTSCKYIVYLIFTRMYLNVPAKICPNKNYIQLKVKKRLNFFQRQGFKFCVIYFLMILLRSVSTKKIKITIVRMTNYGHTTFTKFTVSKFIYHPHIKEQSIN